MPHFASAQSLDRTAFLWYYTVRLACDGATMERICLICNPTAKSGGAGETIKAVIERLKARGAEPTVYMTGYPGHATELSRRALAEGYDLIAAVGGDGTMRETAVPLIHSDATFAVVPCGTGNDFARALGIGDDPDAAAEMLLGGETRMLDAGTANEEVFFNVAGFGFDVDVLDYTEQYKPKCKNGSTAYLRGLLKALFGMKLRRSVITLPNETLEMNVLLIAAGNGRFFGGGMEVTPNADPADGLLDICIIHDVGFFGALTVLPRFMKGKHLGSRYVTYRKERTCAVTCEPVSRIEVDGERMPGTPVTFRILEKALRIRLPRR